MNHSCLQIFTNCNKKIREYNLCCQRDVTMSSSPEKQRKLSRLFTGLWTAASKYFQYPIPQRKNPLGCKCIQVRATPYSAVSSINWRLKNQAQSPFLVTPFTSVKICTQIPSMHQAAQSCVTNSWICLFNMRGNTHVRGINVSAHQRTHGTENFWGTFQLWGYAKEHLFFLRPL